MGKMRSSESSTVEPTADEVGFLLLEDCILQFNSRGFQKNTWIDVDFTDADEGYQEETSACRRGSISLRTEDGDDGQVRLILGSTTRFDGSMEDARHSSSCPPCCRDGHANRSDPSLLLGLAMTCQELRHIHIETIQLRINTGPIDMENDDDIAPHKDDDIAPHKDDDIAHHKDDDIAPRKVAFLITFSMPLLVEGRRGKLKALPSATQLLLSIMRSDWEYLSSGMGFEATRRFQDGGELPRDTFFPPNMSLEELYSRLRGLQTKTAKVSSRNKQSPFAMIPHEVIQMRIAPFLRARSLNAWRSTCSELHQALKAVVPGLKLVLYSHQIRSLEWMRSREVHEWTENDVIEGKCSSLSIDGDCHRCITAGATVLLRPRRTPGKVIRVDAQSGQVCEDFKSSRGSIHLSRRITRGGLLCDDPGLGKTITVLSLILQTLGLSSEEKPLSVHEQSEVIEHESDVFHVYWREQLDPIYQRQKLNRLTRLAQRLDDESIFQRPVCTLENPDYLDVIDEPMCFRQISRRITNGTYTNNFSAYVDDVELIFRNAMTYNDEDDDVHELAKDMLHDFNNLVAELKKKIISTARKSFSNSTARPNSSVAAILERKIRQEYMASLVSSSATLLVVPETLLNHWVEQITMHVDLQYWTSKEPVIFHFKTNDDETLERMNSLQQRATAFEVSPLIFIDHSSSFPLPGPEFLALFKVVLTTTKRFTHEYKKGSFEAEMKQKDGTVNPYAVHRSSKPKMSACSLLKVHWTRMVVDEGHSMGRGKQNNAILFASWIAASRRWSMTGTPTPQTSSRSGMTNLLCLMGFLKHEFFTARLNGDRFWALLSRSWNAGSLASFFHVRSLLAVLMMRHTKLDIEELPPPHFERVWLNMSRDEQTTFNTLVCAVQSNLLLTSMKGKTSGLQDSLLHKSQAKHARLAFENLRLACSGGLRIVPQITGKAWAETEELLDIHDLSDVKKRVVLDYMQRAVTEERSHCMKCGFEVSTLLILPCGDLVCTECMTSDTRSCLICETPFDVDDFQRLQPGIVYEWYDYYKHEEEKKKADALDNEVEDETRLRRTLEDEERINLAGHVAIQPAVPTRRKRKRGDGHACEYSVAAADGKCLLCHEEHDECVMITEGSRCSVCRRASEICPPEESKFHYVISRLDQLQAQTRRNSKFFSPAASLFVGEQIGLAEDRPLKVIIFSQFRKVLNLIGHRLIRRYGAGAVAEFWGSYRTQELSKFKTARDCFCMLLSKDGSEGLDLSFVTHICFLEEIWDKSLQDQAVARAWRMGAKGRVEVETLLAKDSVESLMTEVEQKMASKNRGGDNAESTNDVMRSKMVDILGNLRLMGRSSLGLKRKVAAGDDGFNERPKKNGGDHRVRFED